MSAMTQTEKSNRWINALKWPFRRDGREAHVPDRVFQNFLWLIAIGIISIFVGLFYFLYQAASPAINEFGWKFFWTNAWNPVTHQYGALAFIWGTLASSFIALIIAVPISVGAALFLTELSPRVLRGPVGFLVEMLAAIPSIVYGLWGIFVLAPWVREWLQPILGEGLGFLPFFQGPPLGVGLITSGIILAIMVTPTITAVSREVFRSIPDILREGALALGATRWEMIKFAVLKTGFSGLVGAVILGLGRALGETMAVTMVIGNKAQISISAFEPAATMASVIANEYAEANNEIHLASLAAVGFALLFVSLLVNTIARLIIWRSEHS
jgi:phosphate transport system permease protein